VTLDARLVIDVAARDWSRKLRRGYASVASDAIEVARFNAPPFTSQPSSSFDETAPDEISPPRLSVDRSFALPMLKRYNVINK